MRPIVDAPFDWRREAARRRAERIAAASAETLIRHADDRALLDAEIAAEAVYDGSEEMRRLIAAEPGSAREVAGIYEVSHMSVARWRREFGITPAPSLSAEHIALVDAALADDEARYLVRLGRSVMHDLRITAAARRRAPRTASS